MDVVGVVRVLVTLAKPDVALCSIVISLGGRDLQFSLDVAIVVSFLVVVDLFSTCRLHTCAQLAVKRY